MSLNVTFSFLSSDVTFDVALAQTGKARRDALQFEVFRRLASSISRASTVDAVAGGYNLSYVICFECLKASLEGLSHLKLCDPQMSKDLPLAAISPYIIACSSLGVISRAVTF